MPSNESGTLTFQTMVPALLNAVPEFHADEENVRENIPYLVFNELVDYAFGLRPEADQSVLRHIFAFLERASESSDKEVQMLLRDVAWAMAGHWNLKGFENLIGPNMLKFIKQSPAGSAQKC